jgi:enoyl-CoA hydratase/carnithine racemase
MSSFGLANLIVPRNELIEAATGFLQKILINPPDIVSLTLKRMRMLESSNSFSDNQQMGQLFLEDLMSHPDYIEGITSFLDKRKPAWGNMRMKEKR